MSAAQQINLESITWDDGGTPRSVRFDDHYFCRDNGLAESQFVFCEGNDLRSRWGTPSQSDAAGPFTIIETGFGSGLNTLCTAQLWRECGPPDGLLQYISLDRYPMSPADLARTLALWPPLNDLAGEMNHVYPRALKGETVNLDGGGCRMTLQLFVADVTAALDEMAREGVTADAWFLDGFAPAKNPAMWSDDVLTRVAALSRPGSTVSTFTAAGAVRRGLQARGFCMQRSPGFGRKKHMLRGVFAP